VPGDVSYGQRLSSIRRSEAIFQHFVGSAADDALGERVLPRAEELPDGLFVFVADGQHLHHDLTESRDSFATNLGIDAVLRSKLTESIALYAGEHDLTDPYLSPLFGDFTPPFPPTFLQTGTRDLFLSNTVRLHRRLREAGVEADLHVFEAMPHGGFFGAPEDEDVAAEVRRFLAKHLADTP